jgi:SAM-dependent methyltransferase
LKPLLSTYIENQRINIIKPYLKEMVLDLGCGYTKIPLHLSPSDVYIGIDSNPKAIKWNREQYPNNTFLLMDFENDPLSFDSGFTTLLMIAVIEHIHIPDLIFSQLSQLLKLEGTLILTTPTPLGGFIHKLGAYLGLFYKTAMQDHVVFYNRKSLCEKLTPFGFELTKYQLFLFSMNQLYIFKKT